MYENANAFALAGLIAALSAVPASAQVTVANASAERPAAATHVVDREIAVGETKTGALATSDPQLDDGEHYHSYTFHGRANDRIVVSLTSTSFDTYLAIFTTEGDWEDQDDDSGGSSNAQLNVTLPRTGRYVIVVTSYAGDETGEYTLSVGASQGGGAGEDWKRYGTTSHDEAELYYLESSVRRYSERVYEVWTRWVYAGMQEASPGGDPYDSEKRLMRVDCATERLGIVSFVEYSGEAAVNTHTVKDVDLNPAVPGSVGASLLRHVCSGQQQRPQA